MRDTYKYRGYLGDMPGPMATEWWTKEDWERWDMYVEGLKFSGEYGKPVEYDITLQSWDALSDPKISGPLFINMGMMMPLMPLDNGKPPIEFFLPPNDKIKGL